MSLKRKSPLGSMSASPGPGRPSIVPGVAVKEEDDAKRRKMGGIAAMAGLPNFRDPRTAVMELRGVLKDRMTLGWQDAWFHVADRNPGMDVNKVLDMLKTQERVSFNETNRVFTYEPEVLLRTAAELRTYIRTNTQPLAGLAWKDLREAMPGPEAAQYVDELERNGDVLVLRSLAGRLKDAPLPALGRQNGFGEKINAGGQERWRMIFWDDLKERGRAGIRVDDETVAAWADVRISETDDVAKLLQEQNLDASSAPPPPPKVVTQQPKKKQRASRRPARINNVHMKALGIDFSKDYET
ncbi:hypothetical protein Q5752_001599 [Cryptotrichosporon argae]